MELKFLLKFLNIEKQYNLNLNCNVNITIDSRKVNKNDVFIGIKGKYFNGSDYAKDAIDKGAILAIVDDKEKSDNKNIFYVKNSIKFLGDLANTWRDEINPVIFGITGSSGKTTVKEIVSIILQNSYGSNKVLTTLGNFNNHIGLPLTFLSLKKHHKYAVIEMGMNHYGEIEYLSKIVKPDYALINNIQRAHIGCGFNSLEEIAKAKSEIFTGLKPHKTVILPADDKQYEFLKKLSLQFKQITFGIKKGDFKPFDINLNSLYSTFSVNYLGSKIELFLPIPGLHNISNALAAIAMASDLKISSKIIVNSIKNFKPIIGRLNILKLKDDITLINDSYNSNPDSMKFAIDVLSKFNTTKILIAGDMGELGDKSLDYHFEIGKYAKDKKIDIALFVGDLTKYSKDAFGYNSIYFYSKDSLINYLLNNLKSPCTILIKGSRFMGMEYIFLKLKEKLMD